MFNCINAVLLSLCLSSIVSAAACPANFVSAKYSRNENTILFWQNLDGKLTEVETPYSTESYISNISSTIDQRNQPLIVWIESGDRDNRLMMLAKDRNKKWLSPVVISASKKELSSPSLIRAGDGSVFLAWASDQNGNDDVYLTQYFDDEWTDVKAVNIANKVPDILPKLSIENDGSVGLAWRSFKTPIIGYEDQYTSLTPALTQSEMQQVLQQQCDYDRASIKHPESDEPLFINYYQDIFNSFEKRLY